MKLVSTFHAITVALAVIVLADRAEAHDESIFAFGGVLTTGNMHQSARPLRVGYEGNSILGFGYQNFSPRDRAFHVGMEVGAATRLGGRATNEFWAGVVMRHDGADIGPNLRIASALTVGLSHITATHRGRETALEERYEGNATTLFYLGPELSLSRADTPGREVFWRLHHRSGGGQTLGNMKGAANANVIGFRYTF